MTRVLSMQTNNPQALFNRAVAYLNSDRLDDARADYETLAPNLHQLVPGRLRPRRNRLAQARHQRSDQELRGLSRHARTNTAEATNILQRLRELKK
jgi:hypothetical protein